MEISTTMKEDLISNLILGAGFIIYMCSRDLCKRVAHSDCVYDSNDGGLKIRLPTWRETDDDEKDV